MKKFVFLITLFFIGTSYAKDADIIYVGGGVFDLRKERHRTAEFRLEYMSSLQAYRFRPTFGLMATAKGSAYGYVGFNWDWIFKKHLIFAPNFAVGYYHQGGGKDLGYPLEFRTGIEIGYKWDNCVRAGIHFCHLSNASIGQRNPGVESLVFRIGIPLNYLKNKGNGKGS